MALIKSAAFSSVQRAHVALVHTGYSRELAPRPVVPGQLCSALHAWSSSRFSFLKDITSIKDQRCSKDDRSDRSPSLASVSGASELLQHVVCWVLDGNSKSCRCSQSSTCPCQEPGAAEQHGDQLHRWSLKTHAGPRLLALPVAGGR